MENMVINKKIIRTVLALISLGIIICMGYAFIYATTNIS